MWSSLLLSNPTKLKPWGVELNQTQTSGQFVQTNPSQNRGNQTLSSFFWPWKQTFFKHIRKISEVIFGPKAKFWKKYNEILNWKYIQYHIFLILKESASKIAFPRVEKLTKTKSNLFQTFYWDQLSRKTCKQTLSNPVFRNVKSKQTQTFQNEIKPNQTVWHFFAYVANQAKLKLKQKAWSHH